VQSPILDAIAAQPEERRIVEQQRQAWLRGIWQETRSLQGRVPWSEFTTWVDPGPTGQIEVLIVRRDPDGSFESITYDTISGGAPAVEAAELMWRARAAAEQHEADAIADHEASELTVAERRDAAARAAAADPAHRIETEGLVEAMRGIARADRP
jgi:hypothetical protein